MTKERIFSVGARDCRWDYYRGSGKGGQHRNKKSTAVRCVHIASGAVGCAEDQREQKQNKRLAFERMARTQTFQRWAKAEGLKRLGILADIETKINADLLANTVVETLDDGGVWVTDPELQVTKFDIENLKD